MLNFYRRACAGIAGCGLVAAAACSSSKPSPGAPPAQALWGDLKPVVSVKELMRDMIDPASDFIFDAVKVVSGKDGTVETVPKTDEEWDRVRIGAVTLAEGIYLLKIPRPFVPPGEEDSKDRAPEELPPAEIKAKLEKDPVLWNAKIEALRNVGLEVLDVVKARKAEDLWQASDDLDNACETCHVAYWYPTEGEYLKELDRKLERLYGNSPLLPTRTGRGR